MNGKNESPFLLSDDGWIHVTPVGEFPHHVGFVQVIDRRACDLMADDFAKRRKEEGDRFAGLLVDYDHFSLDTEKPSEAAGWLTEHEARDDGLWGRVRWTDAGLPP
jgi:phage I-like protein